MGQTEHLHLVNKHWELVLCETVFYMVDRNGKFFPYASIISEAFHILPSLMLITTLVLSLVFFH